MRGSILRTTRGSRGSVVLAAVWSALPARSTRRRSRALPVVLALALPRAWPLAVALAPAPVVAAEPTEAQLAAARRQFGQAIEFTRQKRWIEALELLRAIAAVKDTGGVRFYTAQCEEKLAQLRAAEADYLAAIRLAPAMGVDEAVTIARQSEEALARLRPRIPQISLQVAPVAGLTVSLDGRALSADELAQPLPHDPGEAHVRASAPGRPPFERSLVLAEGSRTTVELTFAPVAPSPAPPAPVAAPAPTSPRWPAYLTGAVAVGALGSGAGFYLRHRRLDDESERVCSTAYRCDRAGRDDKLAFYRNLGLVSAGVALVAGAATVVLWRASSSDTQVAVRPDTVWLQTRW